jgi:sugar/nucleoside kinase (ribokinase family)
MSKIEVIGLGALNVDRLYQAERVLAGGETAVDELPAVPGGSAANTIYGLAKLGVRTGFIGVVGDDAEGRMLVQDFQKVGTDTSQIKVKPEIKTGSVLCFIDKLGERSLYVSPGVNTLLTLDDLDMTYIDRAKMLHLSSSVDDRQFKMSVELAERLDLSTKLSFTPGALYVAKGLKALRPVLSKTYVLFTNQREIQELTGKDFKAGAEICLEQGCRIVAVTLGKGVNYKDTTATSYIRDDKNEYTVESESEGAAPVLDTTGAGDAFASGFLYGLLKGKGLEKCSRLGDIAARFCIAKLGAREGLPDLKELSRRYQELYGERL